MIGPVVKIAEADLPRAANIHWLGARAYADLPSYMTGWDVALMPFAMNEATRFISPTKTPEYLAAGLQVVSTPVRDVVRHYGALAAVRIAQDAVEFTQACADAIAARTHTAWRDEADRTLATLGWDVTFRHMNRLVTEAQDHRRSAGGGAASTRASDRFAAPGIRRGSSTHRLRNGRRLDMLAATGHDSHAAQDYRQLAGIGIRACRDAARWHLSEPAPGRYDFTSLTPMIEAARDTGTQIVWDWLHYGWPDDLDIWRPEFVTRFAAFARALAHHHKNLTDTVPFWCPINRSVFSHGRAGMRATSIRLPQVAGSS